MQESRNIAARVGRWSARHRKTAIIGWITFVVLAFMIGGKVGTETLTQDQAGVGDSGKASKIVSGAFPEKHDESVLIQSKGLKDDSPEFHAVVADVKKRLEATKGVDGDTRPLRPEGSVGRSPVTAIRRWSASRSPVTPRTPRSSPRSTRPSPQTEAAQKAHGDFNVEQFGSRQLRGAVHGDLQQGPREGDVRLASDHADPPGHRVRHAGRGGNPAAAGDHRHRGHHGPGRPAQPDLTG